MLPPCLPPIFQALAAPTAPSQRGDLHHIPFLPIFTHLRPPRGPLHPPSPLPLRSTEQTRRPGDGRSTSQGTRRDHRWALGMRVSAHKQGSQPLPSRPCAVVQRGHLVVCVPHCLVTRSPGWGHLWQPPDCHRGGVRLRGFEERGVKVPGATRAGRTGLRVSRLPPGWEK